MALKGVNLLNNILNEFLEPFDATAKIGPDFCYYYTDSTIQYALCISEKADRYFTNHIKRLAPDIHCDTFLISFLHELGHHETIDEISESDDRFSRNMKDTIDDTLESPDGSDPVVEETMHDLYFNLPDEAAATAWAIDYIRTHVEEIKVFWERVQAAIMLIYELNEVEIDEF
jgi:hypothetical protein